MRLNRSNVTLATCVSSDQETVMGCEATKAQDTQREVSVYTFHIFSWSLLLTQIHKNSRKIVTTSSNWVKSLQCRNICVDYCLVIFLVVFLRGKTTSLVVSANVQKQHLFVFKWLASTRINTLVCLEQRKKSGNVIIEPQRTTIVSKPFFILV